MVGKNTKWLWSISYGYRKFFALAGLVGIVRVFMALSFVWLSKRLIDIASNEATGSISHFILLLVFVSFFEILLSGWESHLEISNTIRVQNKLRQNLFNTIMISAWNGKENFHSADLVNRLDEDVKIIASAFSKVIPLLFVTTVQIISAFIFLHFLSTSLSWVIIIILPIFMILTKLAMKKLRRLTKAVREGETNVQTHVQEKIQHKVLIQTLEQGSKMTSLLNKLHITLEQLVLNRSRFTLIARGLAMLSFAIGYLIAFVWGINGLSTGVITFGTMTAFLQLVGQIQRPLSNLGSTVPTFVHAIASSERLQEVTELQTENIGDPIFLEKNVGIRVVNITFSYTDSSRKILDNFSYDFKPLSRTSILGETGVGKSTLIRLMLSLINPNSGNIIIYDDTRSIVASSLTRCNLAYVPQGNTLLSGTILENLLLAKPDATEKEIQNVLHIAVADFVYDLPNGLNSICGERGSGLSEGQAQRIGIARGLLRPGKILLLDEFSSSLDPYTEKTLMERLVEQAKDKTLIFITHREIITTFCDNVVKLKRTDK